jgi:thiol-disulfide isomerase/thioredoxin
LIAALNPPKKGNSHGRLSKDAPSPTEIKLHQTSRVLEIAFSDGKCFKLPYEFLRVYSPSAEVRGHGPGQEVLQVGKKNIEITKIDPVGTYAVQWSEDSSLVVVALCAAWCDTCNEFRTSFERIAERRPDIVFVWLDIEDDSDVCGDIDVENFPTLAIYRGSRSSAPMNIFGARNRIGVGVG